MAMENGPGMKMYFPIEHGDFPLPYVSLLEGTSLKALNIYRKTTPFDPRVYHLHSYDQGNELLAVEVCPNTLEMRYLGKLPMVFWLVVSTHLKNISQIGSFPQSLG